MHSTRKVSWKPVWSERKILFTPVIKKIAAIKTRRFKIDLQEWFDGTIAEKWTCTIYLKFKCMKLHIKGIYKADNSPHLFNKQGHKDQMQLFSMYLFI